MKVLLQGKKIPFSILEFTIRNISVKIKLRFTLLDLIDADAETRYYGMV